MGKGGRLMEQTKPVTTRVLNWAAEVRKAWGDEYQKPDVAYEFSNGRKFESSDRGTTGFYRRS